MREATAEKVRFVPFDGRSDAHAERLYHQRVACGWGEGDVDTWREHCEAGTKGLWWLVLEDGISDREKMIEEHIAQYPDEKDTLQDTATTVLRTPLSCTGSEFHPVGHVGLEWKPEEDRRLGLPASGVVWLSRFFISHPLQGYSLGRSAMRQVEGLAVREPTGARAMALDTQKGESQASEETIYLLYTARGLPIPSVLKTNEEWYKRQGYVLIGEEENAYPWPDPRTGTLIWVPRVFLKKDLV
ncbi:uncharacterized protein DNG_02527 [Cephalotrichum gorgonifer]|uniref:Uncharacterized protein n=1 Tax=Cephalotrichum gorgonifer TaxID=2041049 RepID=A0AAE8MTN5_9PEZI|nr:uncharacterized protein DNG_02527 [Cephalotrichum gorgonifer]